MRRIKFTAIITLAFLTLAACNGIGSQDANAEGFGAIEKELKSKFGDNAYYTDLVIIYDNSMGSSVSTTVTADPESMKMGQWTSLQGVWKQNSEITLEVSEGSKAADFMFQLNDKINLTTLGGLVEKSITHLKAEKDLKNPQLTMASVKYPKDGDITKAEYSISLEPENGGTTFSYRYTLSGELVNMDY